MHVHEHRLHIVVQNDVARCDERHRRHEHLVAVVPTMPFLERRQRDVQGARPAIAKHRELAVMLLGEPCLEFLGERAVR